MLRVACTINITRVNTAPLYWWHMYLTWRNFNATSSNERWLLEKSSAAASYLMEVEMGRIMQTTENHKRYMLLVWNLDSLSFFEVMFSLSYKNQIHTGLITLHKNRYWQISQSKHNSLNSDLGIFSRQLELLLIKIDLPHIPIMHYKPATVMAGVKLVL